MHLFMIWKRTNFIFKRLTFYSWFKSHLAYCKIAFEVWDTGSQKSFDLLLNPICITRIYVYLEILYDYTNKMLFKLKQIIHVFFSIFSSGDHFVNRSETVLAILVQGHLSNIPMKFEWNRPRGIGGVRFKDFAIFSSGGHLVYRSETILASLVGSHLGNIPVKF